MAEIKIFHSIGIIDDNKVTYLTGYSKSVTMADPSADEVTMEEFFHPVKSYSSKERACEAVQKCISAKAELKALKRRCGKIRGIRSEGRDDYYFPFGSIDGYWYETSSDAAAADKLYRLVESEEYSALWEVARRNELCIHVIPAD